MLELPYIAGLFDGEGSVCITRPSLCSPRRHRVIVQIAMTHEGTITALKTSLGGRIQIIDASKYNANAKTRYDWRLSDSPAVAFLRTIRPWLITKAEAVDIASNFPLGTPGRRLTDAIIDDREQLRLQLSQANSRGL